jgi:hypothetical protein
MDIDINEWKDYFESKVGEAFLARLKEDEQYLLENLSGHLSVEDYRFADGMLEGVRRVMIIIDELKGVKK